jgi:glucosamine--fructose-6-phosphate aminotransferase (isomerizing)
VFNTVQLLIGSEANANFFPKTSAGLLSISQSGETADLIKAINLAKPQGVVCFNVVNTVESQIAKLTKCGVFCNAGRESSVASTKAFMCQVISLCLIGAWFAERKNPGEKLVERHLLMESIKMFVFKLY